MWRSRRRLRAGVAKQQDVCMVHLPEPSGWIAITFTGEGLISSITSSAEQIVGTSSSKLAGRSITDVLEDSTVFKLPALMDQATDEGFWRGEVRHRDRSGRPLVGFGTLAPVALADRPGPGFLLITTFGDCTPLNESLQYEVGSRLRRFCHELNNPLAVMLGFAQLTILNPQCSEKIRTDMEKVYSELKRAIEVVQRLHQYGVDLQENRGLSKDPEE